MSGPYSPAGAVVAVLNTVIFALLLRAALALWLDCGKPCGAAAKPMSPPAAGRARGGR